MEAFATASRRSDDYDDASGVSSRCWDELSHGTLAWIAECHRLLDRAVELSSTRTGTGDVVAAFELLFDLSDDVDDGGAEILYFADEGGAYEIDVPWESVLEAWFDCFARHAEKDGSYERRVSALIERSRDRAGEASQRLAQVVSTREPPKPPAHATRTDVAGPRRGPSPPN